MEGDDELAPLTQSLLQAIQDIPEELVISILQKSAMPLCCQIQNLPGTFHPHAVRAALPSLQDTGTVHLNFSALVHGKTNHTSCHESEHRTPVIAAVLNAFSSHACPRVMRVDLAARTHHHSHWEVPEPDDETDTCVHVHVRDNSADRNLLNSILAPLSCNTAITGLYIELLNTEKRKQKAKDEQQGFPKLPSRVMKAHEEVEIGVWLSYLTHLRSLSIQGVNETDPTGWLAAGLGELVNLTCLQGCGVQASRCLDPVLSELTSLQVLNIAMYTCELLNSSEVGEQAEWVQDKQGCQELGSALGQLTQLTVLALRSAGLQMGQVYQGDSGLGIVLEECLQNIQSLVNLRIVDQFTGYCRCTYMLGLKDADVRRMVPFFKQQQLQSLAVCVPDCGTDGIVAVLEHLREAGQCTSLELFLDTCNDLIAEALVDTFCCMLNLSQLKLDFGLLDKKETRCRIEAQVAAMSELECLQLVQLDRETYEGC